MKRSPSLLKSISKKKLLLLFIIILILLLAFTFSEATDRTSVFEQKSGGREVGNSTNDAETTSEAPTAQSDFSAGDDRQDTRTDRPYIHVDDKKGSISSIPDENQWTVSSSGLITVYTPSKNGNIASGFSLTGKSALPVISYRLIDDISGVIARGELTVTNGTYSGAFTFETEATQGRLDVFNTKTDGVEQNNIEIPVTFK